MTIIPGTAGTTDTSVQNAVSATQSQSGNSRSILDKDAFLKLLITQLANQDPTNPMQDRDFIAQMAQFSSLEQMNNVANELRGLRQMFSLSSDLIGKTIEWKADDGSGTVLTGVVESILLRDGETLIVSGDAEIPFDRVIRVTETPVEQEQPETGDPEDEGGEQST